MPTRRSLRWLVAGLVPLAAAAFLLIPAVGAQDARPHDVRVQVHVADLDPADGLTCTDPRPDGRAVSRQAIAPSYDPLRAVLGVSVSGLHCHRAEVLLVYIQKANGSLHRIGLLRVGEDGRGAASFHAPKLPYIAAGDLIFLTDRADHRILFGKFRQVRHDLP